MSISMLVLYLSSPEDDPENFAFRLFLGCFLGKFYKTYSVDMSAFWVQKNMCTEILGGAIKSDG